jgi:hypothetical protein
MIMFRWIALLAALTLMACHSNSQSAARNALEARTLTQLYTNSALASWKVRAAAAGRDCRILHVKTSIIMEDAMVDALHFGAGAYDIYEGGVHSFSTERAFRGVAYTDATGKMWTYDAVTAREADRLEPCR